MSRTAAAGPPPPHQLGQRRRGKSTTNRSLLQPANANPRQGAGVTLLSALDRPSAIACRKGHISATPERQHTHTAHASPEETRCCTRERATRRKRSTAMCANGRNELRRGRRSSHHATWPRCRRTGTSTVSRVTPPEGRAAFQASLLFPLGVHTNAVSQTLSVKRALETERAPQAAVLADQAWPPRPCREGLRTVTAYPREAEPCS